MSHRTDSVWLKKVGQHRGAPRIWFETHRIAAAGLRVGTRFELVVLKVGIQLRAAQQGPYQVSSKCKNGRETPVVDLNYREGMDSIAAEAMVRIVVRPHGIYILPLASELAKRERLKRLQCKLQSGMPIAMASLAHGAGILSHAAHAGIANSGLPVELVLVNEIDDQYVQQSLRCNSAAHSHTMALCMPMQELVQDTWVMNQLPTVEVLEMGLPCSGASKAGKSKLALTMMENHPQVGHLVFAALALVQRLQPVVVVLENVVEYSRSASAEILRHQLADMGYQIREHVLSARDFGALENRVRWALVATTCGLPTLDRVEHEGLPTGKLADLLESVPLDSPMWSELGYLREKASRDKLDGKGFAMQIVTPESTSVPTIRKQYNKGGSTDPYVQHPQNPRLLRKFTPGEHARIKGVPVELVDGLAATTAHEVLGQGIAYAPFEALFRGLGHALQSLGGSEMPLVDSLPSSGWKARAELAVG